jgi:SnoaL-like domain
MRSESTHDMTLSILTHPIATFAGGLLVALASVFLFLSCSAAPNRSAEDLAAYRKAMEKVAPSGLAPGGPGEKAALERFKSFLQGIGDTSYVHENALKVYAADAYLDDTLAIHHGGEEIESYFVKTSETMTSYQVTIEDTARSGEDFYIRWTMVFAAPALSGGKPVHSVGISQVRFNREGKVAFHRDFWDSGQNFYAHLPAVGGAVGFVKKRLQEN